MNQSLREPQGRVVSGAARHQAEGAEQFVVAGFNEHMLSGLPMRMPDDELRREA